MLDGKWDFLFPASLRMAFPRVRGHSLQNQSGQSHEGRGGCPWDPRRPTPPSAGMSLHSAPFPLNLEVPFWNHSDPLAGRNVSAGPDHPLQLSVAPSHPWESRLPLAVLSELLCIYHLLCQSLSSGVLKIRNSTLVLKPAEVHNRSLCPGGGHR